MTNRVLNDTFTLYSIIVTFFIIIFAKPLLYLFIDKNDIEILNTGIQYLYIVSTFYCLIGYLNYSLSSLHDSYLELLQSKNISVSYLYQIIRDYDLFSMICHHLLPRK